jgi:hypothetical protein
MLPRISGVLSPASLKARILITDLLPHKITSRSAHKPQKLTKLIEQMAEVLGVVASGISVAQIAGQLLGCVQQLRTLCRALRDTPGELQGILDELEILGEVFYQLRALQIDSSQPGYSALRASLGHCRMAASKLETIAVAGSRALQDSKKRAWFLMKAVLRREEVRELKVQLEAAKSLLHLAMTCYSL